MGKRGPQPWSATDEQRKLVQHYTALGYTQDQIAGLLGICKHTLIREFRDELDHGALKVNAQIGGKLFQKAMGGDTAALIFWAKTRLGWKETSVTEVHDLTAEILAERRAKVAKLNGE